MKRWTAFALFLAFISLVIYAADTRRARNFFNWYLSYPLADKIGHFALIGTLAYLLNRALRCRAIPPGLQLGGIIVAVFVLAEECSQLWIPGRTFDAWDLLADALGILAADLLARRSVRA